MSTSSPREMTAHNNLHAVLFQATSAEYAALCVQTYQLARYALLERLNSGTFIQPAIIFDLDETVLDNHAYQVWQIKNGTNYSDTTWNQWCSRAEAGAVPGAVEFIRFVESHRTGEKACPIKPIFITSRVNDTRKATLLNLYKLGVLSKGDYEDELELADKNVTKLAAKTRLFMKGMDSPEKRYTFEVPWHKDPVTFELGTKFQQRSFVEQIRNYEIILSVGDNLGDYAEYYGAVYDKGSHTFWEEKADIDKPSNAPIAADKCRDPKEFFNKLDGKHPSVAERRAAVLQDMQLFGRDFILLPNPVYGGWLRAMEFNKIAASDELARAALPVRKPLEEPVEEFEYIKENGNPDKVKAKGSKLSLANSTKYPEEVRVWDGNPA